MDTTWKGKIVEPGREKAVANISGVKQALTLQGLRVGTRARWKDHSGTRDKR